MEIKLADINGQESIVPLILNDWIDVQNGRYRYQAIDDGDLVRIKMVIGEYLVCEVSWQL